MSIRKVGFIFNVFLILMFALSFNMASADGSGSVKLSYKIVESNSTDNTLNMLAKLKVQNVSSIPIFEVTAKNTYSDNVGIDAGQINIGNLKPGDTFTSSDSFHITMNIGGGQESTQKEVIWSVEYTDVNGNRVVEMFKLN